MNLREYLRNEWGKYIRPIMIKDKCEFCGNTEELHLHHIDRFHNLLVETLEELQLQELDIEDYDEFELKQISNFMLAKQIKSDYKTLCKRCHIVLHNKEKYSDEYKNHYYNPNGGYVMINTDFITDKMFYGGHLFRLLFLATNINYDNYIIDKSLKRNNKIKIKDINKIMRLSKTECSYFINFLKDNKLITVDDVGVRIDKIFATKGFNNYNHKSKIFIKEMNVLYDSINNINHKQYGNIFVYFIKNNKNELTGDLNQVIEDLGFSNTTRFRNELSGKYSCIIKKSSESSILINPNIIYFGCLDYSYKTVIEDWC